MRLLLVEDEVEIQGFLQRSLTEYNTLANRVQLQQPASK